MLFAEKAFAIATADQDRPRLHKPGPALQLIDAHRHYRPGHRHEGRNPPLPRGYRRWERAQRLGNRPSARAAQLMTGPASARLDDPEPLGLALHGGSAVCLIRSGGRGGRELALVRHADQ